MNHISPLDRRARSSSRPRGARRPCTTRRSVSRLGSASTSPPVDEVDAAVAVGQGGVPDLALDQPVARAEVMFRMRELVDANRKEIASLVTAEHGKVLSDAMGELARGLENIEFACGVPTCSRAATPSRRRPASTCTRSASRSAWWPASRRSTSRRWCPMWMFANAIACGNTFVLKPSEKDPSASRCSWPSC